MTKIKLDETFTIADITFVNLGIDKATGGVIGVAQDSVFSSTFGANSNFAESLILERLQLEILPKLEADVGPDGLLEFNLDLKSREHPNLYADLKTKIGLPTYQLYIGDDRKLLRGNFNYWWLCTANMYHSVYFISPYGSYSYCSPSDEVLDVRPMCIFNPELFEAEHACKYCGQITEGINEDILCEDCRESLGHTLFSQL